MKRQCFYENVQCNSQKSRFIKKPDANGLLGHVGIKTPVSEKPLLCNILY